MHDRKSSSSATGAQSILFGIRLISFCAFFSSALLLFFGFVMSKFAFEFVLERMHRLPAETNPLAYVVIPLMGVLLYVLASIAFIAGLELWKLRARGRSLAMVSMIFVFLVGLRVGSGGPHGDPSGRITGIGMIFALLSAITSSNPP